MTDSAVQEDFLPLAEPYRRELLAHCYRMLGSVHDAEDLVQETYLRAWRAYDGFEGAVLAAHLALPDRHQRLPHRARVRGAAARCRPGWAPRAPTRTTPLVQQAEVPWLEPMPDAMVAGAASDPAAIVASRDSIRLALIAALQHLPPKQRAVLILRDVLQWPAAEVAEMLDTTTAAVNSALQRARAQLDQAAPEPGCGGGAHRLRSSASCWTATSPRSRATTSTRWSRCSPHDAVWEMPPFTGWYQSRPTSGD